jgi:hypothetical protein
MSSWIGRIIASESGPVTTVMDDDMTFGGFRYFHLERKVSHIYMLSIPSIFQNSNVDRDASIVDKQLRTPAGMNA